MSPEQQLIHSQQMAQAGYYAPGVHSPAFGGGMASPDEADAGVRMGAQVANYGVGAAGLAAMTGLVYAADPFEVWRTQRATTTRQLLQQNRARRAAGQQTRSIQQIRNLSRLRAFGVAAGATIVPMMAADAGARYVGNQIVEGQYDFLATRQMLEDLPMGGVGAQSVLPGSDNFLATNANTMAMQSDIANIAGGMGASSAQVRNLTRVMGQGGMLNTSSPREMSRSFRRSLQEFQQIARQIDGDLEQAAQVFQQLERAGFRSRGGRNRALSQLTGASSLTGMSLDQVSTHGLGVMDFAMRSGYSRERGMQVGVNSLVTGALRARVGEIDESYLHNVGGVTGYAARMAELQLGAAHSMGGLSAMSQMFNASGQVDGSRLGNLFTGSERNPIRFNQSRFRQFDPYEMQQMQRMTERMLPSMILSQVEQIQQGRGSAAERNRRQYALLAQFGVTDPSEQLEFLSHLRSSGAADTMHAMQQVQDRLGTAGMGERDGRQALSRRVKSELDAFFRDLTGNFSENLQRMGRAIQIRSENLSDQIGRSLSANRPRAFGDARISSDAIEGINRDVLRGDFTAFSAQHHRNTVTELLGGSEMRNLLGSSAYVSGEASFYGGGGGPFGDRMNQRIHDFVVGVDSFSRNPFGLGGQQTRGLAGRTRGLVNFTGTAQSGIAMGGGAYATPEEFLQSIAVEAGAIYDPGSGRFIPTGLSHTSLHDPFVDEAVREYQAELLERANPLYGSGGRLGSQGALAGGIAGLGLGFARGGLYGGLAGGLAGAGIGALGGNVASMAGMESSTGVGNIVGTVGGAWGGARIGASLGARFGMLAGPKGVVVGALVGGAIGLGTGLLSQRFMNQYGAGGDRHVGLTTDDVLRLQRTEGLNVVNDLAGRLFEGRDFADLSIDEQAALLSGIRREGGALAEALYGTTDIQSASGMLLHTVGLMQHAQRERLVMGTEEEQFAEATGRRVTRSFGRGFLSSISPGGPSQDDLYFMSTHGLNESSSPEEIRAALTAELSSGDSERVGRAQRLLRRTTEALSEEELDRMASVSRGLEQLSASDVRLALNAADVLEAIGDGPLTENEAFRNASPEVRGAVVQMRGARRQDIEDLARENLRATPTRLSGDRFAALQQVVSRTRAMTPEEREEQRAISDKLEESRVQLAHSAIADERAAGILRNMREDRRNDIEALIVATGGDVTGDPLGALEILNAYRRASPEEQDRLLREAVDEGLKASSGSETQALAGSLDPLVAGSEGLSASARLRDFVQGAVDTSTGQITGEGRARIAQLTGAAGVLGVQLADAAGRGREGERGLSSLFRTLEQMSGSRDELAANLATAFGDRGDTEATIRNARDRILSGDASGIQQLLARISMLQDSGASERETERRQQQLAKDLQGVIEGNAIRVTMDPEQLANLRGEQ